MRGNKGKHAIQRDQLNVINIKGETCIRENDNLSELEVKGGRKACLL